MDHQVTVNVPVDVSRLPDDLEVVVVALVVSGDFGVLKVGLAMPVGAIHGIGDVADLLHVNLRNGVGSIEKAGGNVSGGDVHHARGELKSAVTEAVLGYDLCATRHNPAAALALVELQDQF